MGLEEASFESSLKGISYKPLNKRVFVQITSFFNFFLSFSNFFKCLVESIVGYNSDACMLKAIELAFMYR